ncbi:RNA 2',3'-cyclic phosphodiesterase [candidate division WOR-3 bacterium]|nr:RNA 2',3'-cyclic phosphodiesterase [candidate division WOR-3 bacterium]
MRIFTAIEIPEEAKISIKEIINNINTEAILKWVTKENLHVTLKFIGEIDSPDPIENVLNDVSKDFQPFKISLSGLGAFPSKNRIKVLWVGVDEGKNQLKELYKNIEKRIIQFGFKKEEKDFTPHVTIGRVKKGLLKFPNIDFFYPPFLARKITLFESILTPSGPIYKILYSFPEDTD